MEIEEKNLLKLNKLFSLMDEASLTKEDFLKAFKNVVDFVLRIEKRNIEEVNALKETYNQILEKIRGDHSVNLGDLRKQVTETFVTDGAKRIINEHLVQKLGELDLKLSEADEKMATIKDGKDGKPGQRGEAGYKPIKGIDYFSVDDIKTFSASVTEEIMSRLKGQRLHFGGGGGFSKIAMDSHFADDETPAGTKNGVNTEFTLATTPSPDTSLKVYRGGARQRLTEDYTFSGKTITFLVAPVANEIITCDYRY